MPAVMGIDQTLRVLRIMQCVFIFTIFMYLYVISIVPHQPAELAPAMFLGLAALCLGSLAAAVFVRKRLVGGALERLRFAPDDAVAIGNWRRFTILACVLVETIALFGLALRFVGADWAHVAPFFVVAIATMVLTFPQRP
jgi:hypothetical protein